jgi:hypothetical protein
MKDLPRITIELCSNGSSSGSETLRPSEFFPPSSQNTGVGWEE